MPQQPVTLDFSTMQPLPQQPVTLDFSTAKPINAPATATQPAPKSQAASPTSEMKPTPFLDRLTQIRPDNPRDSLGSRAVNFVGNIGGAGLNTILNPVSTIKGIGHSIANPGETVRSLYEGLNTRPADTTASLIGQAGALGPVSEAVHPITASLAEKAGDAMQRGGEGIINRTIGATSRNLDRGKNPGRGYFEAGMGPSMSMSSIASKASKAKAATGAQIGSAVDEATANGVTIPHSDVSLKIDAPIQNARNVLAGPGGGSTAGIDALADTFKPSLYPRVNTGPHPAMTPREVFDIKKSVGKNTSWGPANDIGLKQTRQQIAGGLSEPLATHVPGLKELNPAYADISELAKLSNSRAVSGSMSLPSIARKGTEAALGAGLGIATHNPALAIAPMALDSVPFRTSLASGLHVIGKNLPHLPSGIEFASPTANIGGVNNKNPKGKSDKN